MYLYYLIIVYLLVLGYYFERTSGVSISKKAFFFLAFGVFFILAAFRADFVGNDTIKYIGIFNKLLEPEGFEYYQWRYETGYLLLNKFLSFISNDPHIIIFTTSAIITFGFARFIYKYSQLPSLSVYLFFTLGYFTGSMNVIRMSLAIVILLWSYDFLIGKKFWPFILIVILASFFHRTAIVFLIMWIFRNVKITNFIVILFFAFGILFYALWPVLINLLISVFPTFSYYIDGQYMEGGIRLASVLIWGINVVVLIIGLSFNKDEDKAINIMTLMLLISSTVLIISFRFNLLDRIATLFNVFIIVYLPNIINNMKIKNNIIIMSSFVVFLFFFYRTIIFIYRPEWNLIFPYEFATFSN